jgi:hypothetical protein
LKFIRLGKCLVGGKLLDGVQVDVKRRAELRGDVSQAFVPRRRKSQPEYSQNRRNGMKSCKVVLILVGTMFLISSNNWIANAQQNAASNAVQVHMVITDQAVREDSELAILQPENVQVRQGKDPLKVDKLIPARGDNAALQLFILIDDTCDSGIGNNLNDLREFINAQPTTTVIGVAYMSNASIQISQNFTADHALAAKAVRLPRGSLSAMDSPYLSLISLVNGWPEQNVRREVLMITDGIDRLRGEPPVSTSRVPSRGRPTTTSSISTPTRMSTISLDADRASTTSQRYRVIVHSIYSPGVGRLGRNAWEAQLGQGGIAKIADETGGEYFALGTQNLVSFKPYLERLQRIFENQYYLVFQAFPRKNAALQRVRITTDVANAEIAAADNVWVPATQ